MSGELRQADLSKGIAPGAAELQRRSVASCEGVCSVSHGRGSTSLALFNIFISNVKEHAGAIVKHRITRAGGGREVVERGTQRMEGFGKKSRAGWQRASKCTWRDKQSDSASLQEEGVWEDEPCTS